MSLYYKGHPAWRNFLRYTIPSTVLILYSFLVFFNFPTEISVDAWIVDKSIISIIVFMMSLVLSGDVSFYRDSISGSSFLLGVLTFFVCWVKRMSTTYLVNGEGVILREGIVSRSVRSMNISDIRTISYVQSVSQRILNIGSITFSSAAGDTDDVIFTLVKSPKEIVGRVETLRSNYEQERTPSS